MGTDHTAPFFYLLKRYSWIFLADFLPAPMARMTVAPPETISPPEILQLPIQAISRSGNVEYSPEHYQNQIG